MSQVDIRNSSAAGKRARTDGSRREDDWTCPSCGNVNFSFRTTCNMRNCTHPRPADHSAKFGVKPQQTPPTFTSGGYMGTGAPSSMYLGAPPYGSPIFNGSVLPPYDLPFSGGANYHYDYGNRLSVGSPYGPLHMSGPPPYSGGSMLGTGGMYGMPPLMDRYGMGMPMGPGSMGPRPGSYYDEVSQKRSADAGRESDWTCPNCGNNNFSFRTVCNMRKCNTPRPGSQASKFEDSKGAKPKMPEGSWKCEKCNNINYPFRTKCNRQNCGAEKPIDANKPGGVAPEGDDQMPSRVSENCMISPAREFVATQLPPIASEGSTPGPRVSEIHRQVSSRGQSAPYQPPLATSQPQLGVSGGSTSRSVGSGSVVRSNEYGREMLDQAARSTTPPPEASDATGSAVAPRRAGRGERGETLRSLYEFSEEGSRSSSYLQLMEQNFHFHSEILRLNKIVEQQRQLICTQIDMHSEILSMWAEFRERCDNSVEKRGHMSDGQSLQKEHLVGEEDKNRVVGVEDKEGEDKRGEVCREKDDG